MPRQNRSAQSPIPKSCKIRKRGCSSSSTSSSLVQNYKSKRAIFVGKRAGSATSIPTRRLSRLPSIASSRTRESPKYAANLPVSARKLAATLWELNEVPSPSIRAEEFLEDKRFRARERKSSTLRSHLSYPSRCPLSEIETRSRVQTPCGSVSRNRLNDASNALTTSKELLKIINRILGQTNRPSSSRSLISSLHAELERAHLQVNRLIQEQHSDQNEISHLMKDFVREKAVWKNKERQLVDAAIESVAGELDVERKLRRRYENLNKKLGRELAESKASLMKAVNELEGEKRTKRIMEQICEDLVRDKEECEFGGEGKKGFARGPQMADILHQKRAQIKLSEAIDKLGNQPEFGLGKKKARERRPGSLCGRSHNASLHSRVSEEIEEELGEVEDRVGLGEESAESGFHSIELDVDRSSRSCPWTRVSETANQSKQLAYVREQTMGRKSTSERVARKNTFLSRDLGSERSSRWEEREEDHGRVSASLTHKWVQPWPSLDSIHSIQERAAMHQGSGLKPRLIEVRGDGQNVRRARK